MSGNAIASVGRLPFSFIDRWYLTNVVRSYAIHLPHKITPFREKHKQKKFRKFNSEIKIPILRKIDYFSRSFYHHFHDRFKSNHFTFCHFGRGGRNKTVRIGVDQRYLPGNNPISRYPGLRITTHQSGYFHGCSFITGKYPLHYLPYPLPFATTECKRYRQEDIDFSTCYR